MAIMFYDRQHEFYSGIDLHTNSIRACAVDHNGDKQCASLRTSLPRKAYVPPDEKRRTAVIRRFPFRMILFFQSG